MPEIPGSPNDVKVEVAMGKLLRIGVLLAASVVLLGGVVYLVRHGGERADYHIFRGEPTDLRSIRGILKDAFTLHGRGIIQLGLLLLIATPVARVAFSLLAFLRQQDHIYTTVTLIVLSVLLYSLFGS
jgi:uncharacterized membrane protein